jgi:hypothetical protein
MLSRSGKLIINPSLSPCVTSETGSDLGNINVILDLGNITRVASLNTTCVPPCICMRVLVKAIEIVFL